MNKITLIDTIIQLHNIARMVEEEFGAGNLSSDIRNCADRLHVAVLGVRIAEAETQNLIDKAKE